MLVERLKQNLTQNIDPVPPIPDATTVHPDPNDHGSKTTTYSISTIYFLILIGIISNLLIWHFFTYFISFEIGRKVITLVL